MASDFSVAWQCLWKRTVGFLLRIKLHAIYMSSFVLKNPRSHTRRSLFEKVYFFSWSPPYFVKWREVL
jgi:hypothetical protein